MEEYNMKTIYIVTGASGHLGGNILKHLLSMNKIVRALVLQGEARYMSDIPGIDVNVAPGLFTLYDGDVRDSKTLDALFVVDEPAEFIVIHCAGIVTIESRKDKRVWEVNVEGTRNIIDACIKHKARRLVYVSSVHAIPVLKKGQIMAEVDQFDPDKVEGLYAKSKAAASQLVLDADKKGLDAVIVHPSGIIGPGDPLRGHTTQLVIDYLKGRLTALVRGGYDFVDVRDVAAGVVLAAEKGRKGECYILSNRYIDIKELFDNLSEICGKKPPRTVLPLWFAKMTAPFAELYYRILRQPPLYTRYSLYTLSENSQFSHEKARKELGYKTRDFKDTLRETVKWLQMQGHLGPKIKMVVRVRNPLYSEN